VDTVVSDVTGLFKENMLAGLKSSETQSDIPLASALAADNDLIFFQWYRPIHFLKHLIPDAMHRKLKDNSKMMVE
jgi:hypothetical protein